MARPLLDELGMEMESAAEGRSIAGRLRADKSLIERVWSERLREQLADRAQPPHEALIDDIPAILDNLAGALADHEPVNEEAFERHATERLDWSAYCAEDLIGEYVLLRKIVFGVLDTRAPIAPDDRDTIIDFFDRGIQVASAKLLAAQRFREDVEMQYLRLIEHLVVESQNTASNGTQRLLRIIVEDLGAQTAAFLLYRDDTIDISLSPGPAGPHELDDLYRSALALATLSGGDDRRLETRDVATLDEPARTSLPRYGVNWLVTVRLQTRAQLPAMLCLGFRDKRRLEPAERHMLEMLGDRLALLLATLQLHEESQEALARVQRQSVMLDDERERLEAERKQRDDTIAAIGHDLKNPLSTARLGAELLRGEPPPGARERLAEQILRSINRTDAMVQDLLDTQRIRAGKRVPLTMQRYAMNDLVDELLPDLELRFGKRFVLHAEPCVAGYWSWEGMRRAVENLLVNAVKHGAATTPITITVATEDDKMVLSVHNEGPAISDQEQARIFEPFERGACATRGSGWGIGLTLTRGIVEAHGGSISVDSTPSHGTTFTIRNPMDSRPFA